MALVIGSTMTQQIRAAQRGFGDAPAAGPHPCQQAGVITLQSMLNAYFNAHAITEDGVYGPVTRGWMQRYQRENQLSVTTYPDEATLRRLGITTMVADVIQHCRLSAQCLARQSGTATTGGGESGGTAATGPGIEQITGTGIVERLGQVEWYWWVGGLAAIAAGSAFAIAAAKKAKRRGR